MPDFTDAFGEPLSVGDTVLAIANTNTTQTFYRGIVAEFTGKCASVIVDKVSLLYEEEYVPRSGDEKRICLSHRIVKI